MVCTLRSATTPATIKTHHQPTPSRWPIVHTMAIMSWVTRGNPLTMPSMQQGTKKKAAAITTLKTNGISTTQGTDGTTTATHQ